MQRHVLRPLSVPLLQHLVVGLLLLKAHLHQHPHLLQLQLRLVQLPRLSIACVRVGLVEVYLYARLLLAFKNLELFLILALQVVLELLQIASQLLLVLALRGRTALHLGIREGGKVKFAFLE
jgi:hypothetical protein